MACFPREMSIFFHELSRKGFKISYLCNVPPKPGFKILAKLNIQLIIIFSILLSEAPRVPLKVKFKVTTRARLRKSLLSGLDWGFGVLGFWGFGVLGTLHKYEILKPFRDRSLKNIDISSGKHAISLPVKGLGYILSLLVSQESYATVGVARAGPLF
jgi:hypothetical protein